MYSDQFYLKTKESGVIELAKVYDFKNYKKEKCFNCNQDHICIDVFGNKMCPECYKELQKYKNMANNIFRKEFKYKELK